MRFNISGSQPKMTKVKIPLRTILSLFTEDHIMKYIFAKKAAAITATGIIALGGAIKTVSAATIPATTPAQKITVVENRALDLPLKIQTPMQHNIATAALNLISDWQMSLKIANVAYGGVKLFSNDNGTFTVGTSLNNSKTYYVNGKWSGKQCYIYAQAVYYYLTGDYVGHGSVGSHSKKCISNVKTTSYTQFKNAGVKPGAYIRTTANSNGSYNGNKGHSMIVVSYDANSITVLEGNGNGKGLVRLNTVTWAQFNSSYLTSRGYRICHVISPK